MDNKEWSDKASYYAEVIEDEENFTSEVTLCEVLKLSMKFKYVFDFGENWSFQCKVLKEINEECSEYSIIRTVGEAPEQYGYDEDDEEYNVD